MIKEKVVNFSNKIYFFKFILLPVILFFYVIKQNIFNYFLFLFITYIHVNLALELDDKVVSLLQVIAL